LIYLDNSIHLVVRERVIPMTTASNTFAF